MLMTTFLPGGASQSHPDDVMTNDDYYLNTGHDWDARNWCLTMEMMRVAAVYWSIFVVVAMMMVVVEVWDDNVNDVISVRPTLVDRVNVVRV